MLRSKMLVTRGSLFTVNIPDEPPNCVFLWCSALSCGLQLNYVTLCWTMGISLKGATPKKVDLQSRAERLATRFIFNRVPLQSVCPPGGTVWVESIDRSRLTLSVFLCPDESLEHFPTLHERDGQRVNTLGCSDTTHPVAISS